MNFRFSVRRAVVAACVCAFAALPALADDEEKPAEEKETKSAEEKEAALPAPAAPGKFFFPLVRCGEVTHATAEVCKPASAAWEALEEGRFYPLGSAFRVTSAEPGAKVAFLFGTGSQVLVTNVAEFATRAIAIGEEARTVELRGGFVSVSLPRALKDGLFSVAAPHFTCFNMAGDSWFDYRTCADGDEATVRVVTGSLAVKGRHYDIVKMGAANRVAIRTTRDALFTAIRGESGDCLVKLDEGLVTQKDFETGETKEVPKTLDFQLSPLCAIKIFRAVSPVGGRMSVSMMTFAPNGQILNRCAFAERRANINSGELVVTRKSLKDADNKAKESEAEATEAVDVAPAADDAKAKKDDAKADDAAADDAKKKDDDAA